MSVKGDPFFMDDFAILWSPKRLLEFFPSKNQTVHERLNSITRLVIYISLATSLYTQSGKAVQFGAVIVIGIILLWRNQTVVEKFTAGQQNKLKSLLSSLGHVNTVERTTPFQAELEDELITREMGAIPENEPCVMPTRENPFGNPLYGDDPNRPEACAGPGISELQEAMLEDQLKEDTEDLFGKRNMQRQFYTLPSTKLPQDREKFQDWAFRDYPSCKTNEAHCAPFQDLRTQREYNFSAENDDSDLYAGIE